MSDATAGRPTEGGLEGLLAGLRDRDEMVVARFVDRYRPLLHRVIRVRGTLRRLQGLLESQDVVQSVLIQVVEEIRDGRGFADEAALEGYLATVGRNHLRDLIRRERAKKRGGGLARADESGLAEQPGIDPTASQVAAAKEEVERVEEVAPSEVLEVLREQADGAGWQELAEARGTSADALRKRVERVRRQIREALEGDGPPS